MGFTDFGWGGAGLGCEIEIVYDIQASLFNTEKKILTLGGCMEQLTFWVAVKASTTLRTSLTVEGETTMNREGMSTSTSDLLPNVERDRCRGRELVSNTW